MICAFSVFSHMLGADTKEYLGEFRRALTPGGRAIATFFTADDVPDETENPSWLGDWTGRLHCVLYSTDYLQRLIAAAGLTITARMPPMEYRPQDALVLKRVSLTQKSSHR
jgi:cyclopropane fatty-acyl-phospholipid synthase-like methyltransferase